LSTELIVLTPPSLLQVESICQRIRNKKVSLFIHSFILLFVFLVVALNRSTVLTTVVYCIVATTVLLATG
jgi:hypothetical protein